MKRPAHRLALPLDRLPAEAAARRAMLDEYFGDLLASVELAESGWVVDLNWPDSEAFFVDPLVSRQLAWWRSGVLLRELRKEVVWSKSGLLSLDDAWTLFAWSHWLKARYERDKPPQEVVIIHVDDHRDMMSPRIAWDGTRWNDLLTGEPFTVFDPQSVRGAILSGAIGVGSFFAPFVHELPSVVVRHLSLSAGWAEDSREWWLLRENAEDTIIRPGQLRPRIGMELMGPASAQQRRDRVAGRYRFTRAYERCLSDLPDCPVLLHIDLDYFNNRYDRDSDWRERAGRHDPGEEEVLAKVDELFAALSRFGVAQRIENVTVALSPGFFPAEFWRIAVEQVERHLGDRQKYNYLPRGFLGRMVMSYFGKVPERSRRAS